MSHAVQTSNYYCHKAEDELRIAVACGSGSLRAAHLDNAAEYVSLAKMSALQLAQSENSQPAK